MYKFTLYDMIDSVRVTESVRANDWSMQIDRASKLLDESKV